MFGRKAKRIKELKMQNEMLGKQNESLEFRNGLLFSEVIESRNKYEIIQAVHNVSREELIGVNVTISENYLEGIITHDLVYHLTNFLKDKIIIEVEDNKIDGTRQYRTRLYIRKDCLKGE